MPHRVAGDALSTCSETEMRYCAWYPLRRPALTVWAAPRGLYLSDGNVAEEPEQCSFDRTDQSISSCSVVSCSRICPLHPFLTPHNLFICPNRSTSYITGTYLLHKMIDLHHSNQYRNGIENITLFISLPIIEINQINKIIKSYIWLYKV